MSVRKIDFEEAGLLHLEAEAKRLKTSLSGLINLLLFGPSSAPFRPLPGPDAGLEAAAKEPLSGPYPAPTEALAGPNGGPSRARVEESSVSWEGGGSTPEGILKEHRQREGEGGESRGEGPPGPPGLPGIETPEQARKRRDRELRDEIEWRLQEVWQSHLKAWKQFMKKVNGVEPSQGPALHPDDIAKPIREALRVHDGELLKRDARERWQKESRVRAAGIGIFYDDWCTGHAAGNDATNGGRRYLEHWRPWKRLHGKPDPVIKFADLYFEARDLAS